jgi:beta-glucanase (GH16 family)
MTFFLRKNTHLFFFISLLVIAVSIPVTLHVSQKNQDIRQHASSTTCTASGEQMPGDLPGWKQVAKDDFSGTSLDPTIWGAPYSGQPGGDPAGWWEPSHVVVNNCMVSLKGYYDAVKPNIFVTGGISMNYKQTYGKYLVRMRADKGNGISAIALLWPDANVWPPEVDFFEDGGGDRMGTSATLHCGPNGDDSCQVQKLLSSYDFSQWHTVGVEWSAGKLIYTIDGTVWATVTHPGVPSIPMVLDLQSQSLACSQWNTCVDNTTPANVDMQVDWVSVYAPLTIGTTPEPTTFVSPTPMPTITTQPSITSATTPISLTVKLHGLGNAGDNANPTGGNPNPIHSAKPITLEVVNPQGDVLNSVSGTITYQATTGIFRGTVRLPNAVATGSYRFRISSPGYLSSVIPGIYTVQQGQSVTTTMSTLVSGDTNNDNVLDILDYNAIMDCWINTTNCSIDKKALTDLDDNGAIDVTDYNLFIRELSVQRGN